MTRKLGGWTGRCGACSTVANEAGSANISAPVDDEKVEDQKAHELKRIIGEGIKQSTDVSTCATIGELG